MERRATELPRHFLSVPFARPLSVKEWFLVLLAAALWSAVFVASPAAAMIALLVGTIFWFAHDLSLGLFLTSFVIFFHGWEIDFGRFAWARDLPIIPSINAPVGDIALVMLCCSVIVAFVLGQRSLSSLFRNERLVVLAVSLFFMSSILSLLFAPRPLYPGVGWYEILRWHVFPILSAGILPFVVLRSRFSLEKVVRVLAGVGVMSSIFGLLSFVMVNQIGWGRVTPYAVWGIAPFGFNHNLLAEPLVAILPLAVWLVYRKRVWEGYIAPTLILVTTLLTLSRAAWLSIACMLVFTWWYMQESTRTKWYEWWRRVIAHSVMPLALVVVGIAVSVYMAVFLYAAPVVRSSTASRLDAVSVVWFATLRAPLLGYGPGSFLPLFQDTALYVMEYGDPLDGHGFIQKIALEQGVFGLVSWGLLLGIFFYRVHIGLRVASGERRTLLLALCASAVGAVVFQLFNTSYFNANMWYPLGLALAGSTLLKYE